MVEVRIADRLAEVSGPDWDSLAGDDGFYSSYDWLRYTETDPRQRSRYLLASDAGLLTGALPVYWVDDPEAPMIRADRYAQMFGFDGRMLVAGATHGYRTTLLLGQHEAGDRSETLTALVRGALSVAREDGCAGIVLPFLTTGALIDLAGVARVRAAFERPEAEINSSGLDLETYTAKATRRVRSKIRADRARFAQAGWTIRVRSLADCWHDAYPLHYQLQSKYGISWQLSYYEDSLSRQARLLGGRSVAFCCEDDAGLAAVALYYRWRDTMYGRLAGFDYDRLRGASEYFATTMYEPIEYAAGHGVTRLYVGGGSYQAKGYRGAVIHPRWNAFIAAGEADDDPGLELVNSATAAQWAADFTEHGIGLDEGEWYAPGRLAGVSQAAAPSR
jgi:predicted N-acyltransferase